MNKKKLLTIAIALALVATIGLGSLAFFNASQSVTNTFYTAKVDGPGPVDPDAIFSLKLTEHDLNGNETTEGVTYEKVLPGSVLAKDPTVTNTGLYDQWVRVDVTFDKADVWGTIIPDAADIPAIFNGFDSTKWTLADTSTGENTVTYSYYYNSKLTAGVKNDAGEYTTQPGSATLFTSVTIPTTITLEQMVALNGFTITVSAAAVQADNNGTSAADAEGWPA